MLTLNSGAKVKVTHSGAPAELILPQLGVFGRFGYFGRLGESAGEGGADFAADGKEVYGCD